MFQLKTKENFFIILPLVLSIIVAYILSTQKSDFNLYGKQIQTELKNMTTKTFKLNTGREIPALGLGMYR